MAASLAAVAVSTLGDDALGDAHIDAFDAFEALAAEVGRPAAHRSEQGAFLRAVEGEMSDRGLLH